MRCSCHVCDTYMTQSEGLELGCVCPQCGLRCRDCLGTDTIISKEDMTKLKKDPFFEHSGVICLCTQKIGSFLCL